MDIRSLSLNSRNRLRTSTAVTLGLGLFCQLSLSSSVMAQSQTLSLSASGHDRFYGVAFDAAGNSFAVGSYSEGLNGADSQILLAKFKVDGQLDTSFGSQGYVLQNIARAGDGEVARSVAVDSQGRILVGGSVEHAGASDPRDRDLALLRFNADGKLDTSYGTDGVAIINLTTGAVDGSGYVADSFGGFTLDKSGQLYVHGSQKRAGGNDSDFVLFRVKSNGSLDKTFADDGRFVLDIDQLSATPKPPVVLADGRVLGTGYMRRGTMVLPVVYRLDAKGRLDTSYGKQGVFNEAVLNEISEVYAAVAQGSSVVTVGYGKNKEQASLDFFSLRLNESGELDPSYGTGGGFTQVDVDGFNDNGRFMVGLPDGRLMLIGGGRYTSANVDGMVTVLSADGIPDSAFGENGSRLFDFGGSNDFLWGVAVSPFENVAVAVGIKGGGAQGDDATLVRIAL